MSSYWNARECQSHEQLCGGTPDDVDPGPKLDRCKSCGAPILWVELPSGKRMPLDALPVAETGNVLLVEDGKAAVLRKGSREKLPPGTPLYRSHFSTCPNAQAHRKER